MGLLQEVEFRVVRIISEQEIIINAGSEKVSAGDKLRIYSTGREIFDPETNESLGTLDFTKAIVTVNTVLPKMCVCKNSETVFSNQLSNLAKSVDEELVRTYPLDIDIAQIEPGYTNKDKTIRVGDKVRKI